MVETYTWWTQEPARLAVDRAAVAARFPDLSWRLEGRGYLEGRLPLWPFQREAPEGVEAVGQGLVVMVEFGHAYPAREPRVFPIAPEPLLRERSFTEWHVLGDGALCLLRDADFWTLRSPLEDLLLKAAGWRLEYHLMKNGSISNMSESGIATSDHLDRMFTS